MTYRGLGEVMGVQEDRVKSLALGRAARLRPSEIAGLVKVYKLRRDWLEEGSGAPELRPFAVQLNEHLLARKLEREVREAAASYTAVAPLDLQMYARVVEAVLAEIANRQLDLSESVRSRLYQAVYEMSVPSKKVNDGALVLLVDLAAESQADAKAKDRRP